MVSRKGASLLKGAKKGLNLTLRLCVNFAPLREILIAIKSVVEFFLACEALLIASVSRQVRLEHLLNCKRIFLNSSYFAHPLLRKQGSAADGCFGRTAKQQRAT